MNKELKSKLKILTIIRHPVGGIRTYIKYTYGNLDKDKYHFTILTVQDEEAKVIKKDLKGFSLELIEVKGKYPEFLLFLKILTTLFRSNFDIIHSQGFTAGVITVLANALSRIPHIITSHDVFREDQFPPPYGFIKRNLLELLLGSADIIHSVSHGAQDNLLKFLPSFKKKRNKLIVIMNGISLEHFAKKNGASNFPFRKEIGVEQDTHLFGFLGRFMPQKGFTYLIDAVKELSEDNEIACKFKVLAVNDGAFIREYKAMIREKKLSEFFIFYGFTPNVDTILNELDALVIPSLWEACPLLPMEAFVLGCPVIATDCVGLKEVVTSTPALIIKKQNSYSIAEALKNLVNNLSYHKTKALEFISVAESRFNVENTAKQLDMLFTRLISFHTSKGRV